ncbi:flavoprotein [Chengkuizengella axinellae]|uniref:Flavoprotein n=1 Tax=Chengkuizengella axinellae TaxID=3064388 RepID=A0ABT9J0Y5_9BACL|nr:flavoprotein [Chengkuizengella sp. 2205SS18-9]MDP5275257.1 flavoprotein [Chengkuizengella sp. 2205SS18-9]
MDNDLKILIGVTGTIGAINLPIYLSYIRKKINCSLDIILTKNAKKFISPLALMSTCDHVYDDLFQFQGLKVPHVNLVVNITKFLIIPCSANFLYKIGNGVGDDLLSCCVLNYDKTIYIAPNMNNTMWNKQSVQRNVNKIKKDGHVLLNVSDNGFKAANRTFEHTEAALPQPDELFERVFDL